MQLNDFQKKFKDLMLDHPEALETPPEDLAAFCQTGDIPLSDRLKVYRNNIVGSLSDVMVATFPITEQLVGREFLELMARSFILENPPTQGCLSLYGYGFSEFVEGFELAKSLPYLPDVVRYELAINKAYYAKDDGALSAESLGVIAPEDLGELKLELRDSVQLVHSRYPLIKLQEFCMSENQDGQFDMDQGAVHLMVYRPALDTQSIEVEKDEYAMLQNLENGKLLGESVEAVMDLYPTFDFQAFLQKHLVLETFRTLPANT